MLGEFNIEIAQMYGVGVGIAPKVWVLVYGVK